MSDRIGERKKHINTLKSGGVCRWSCATLDTTAHAHPTHQPTKTKIYNFENQHFIFG